MFPKTTFRDALLALAVECDRLANGLNTKSEDCSCCGAERYEAFEEVLAMRKLFGYAEGLTKLANATATKKGEVDPVTGWRAPNQTLPAPFLSRVVGERE